MGRTLSAGGRCWQGLVSVVLLTGAVSLHAAATFDATAGLTYTLIDVTNTANPGSLQGLSFSGSFTPAGAPDSSVTVSGDGLVQADNLAVGPIAINDVFAHTFSISGLANDGTITSSHLGHYAFAMSNLSPDSVTVSLRLDYTLSADVNGTVAGLAFADSDILLDYFAQHDPSVAGSDFVNASLQGLTSTTANGSSGLLTFVLAPGSVESLLADVRINGLLEAAPVPVPAGLWLLFSGLGILSRFCTRFSYCAEGRSGLLNAG